MKYKKPLCIIICIFISNSCSMLNDKTSLVHEIQLTASSVELIKWNIGKSKGKSYVKETMDTRGRVIKLEFYNVLNKLVWAGSGFFGEPIIKYEYKEKRITETFFSSRSEISNDFSTSESPYKFIYHLNQDNEIVDVEAKYKIDFNFTVDDIDRTIKHLQFYKNFTEVHSNLNEVFGYQYSYKKMNTISPTRIK